MPQEGQFLCIDANTNMPGKGHTHPMQFCCICDGFDQAQVQALCCQKEAFTDEVVLGGIASST